MWLHLGHQNASFVCGILERANGQVNRTFLSGNFVSDDSIGKLVGHTDNIRAILVSEDSKYVSQLQCILQFVRLSLPLQLLTGSADGMSFINVSTCPSL